MSDKWLFEMRVLAKKQSGEHRKGGWVLVLMALMITVSCAGAKTIYVHPQGNDAWSGQYRVPNAVGNDGPVATLARARDIIRGWKAAGPLTEPVRVVMANGIYPITTPLVLTPQDSGTQKCPVRYEAEAGSQPVISGGKSIDGFVPAGDGIWKTHIPEVAAGTWYFEQLFVEGKRAVRARIPNQGYYNMQKTSETPGENRPNLFRRTTAVPPGSLELLKGLSKAEIRNVTLVAHHKWCLSRRFLREVDVASNTIVTVGEKLKGYSGWPVNTRFYL